MISLDRYGSAWGRGDLPALDMMGHVEGESSALALLQRSVCAVGELRCSIPDDSYRRRLAHT